MPGPFQSLGYRLWHGALRWQRTLAGALRPLEITPTQFSVLGAIYWLTRDGDRPSQVEISRQAGLDAVMTSKLVRTLLAQGLITRADDPKDPRAFRLGLSAKGRAKAEAAVQRLEAAEREFFGALDVDPRVLDEVLQRLSGFGAAVPPPSRAPPGSSTRKRGGQPPSPRRKR